VRENGMKRALAAGSVVLGTWLTASDPLVAERVAQSGWDWLLIDREHGAVDLHTAAAMMAAVPPSCPAVPVVRVLSHEPKSIGQALDAGAYGVLVPRVMDAEQAAAVVRAARYPPAGTRSVAGGRAPLAFGTDAATYFRRANDEVVVLVQIEHRDAVMEADAICAVDGVDGVFVGPSDLSASLGLDPGPDQRDPALVEACGQVAAAARRHGVAAGIMVSGLDGYRFWRGRGFTLFGVTSDVGFMTGAMRAFLASARGGPTS